MLPTPGRGPSVLIAPPTPADIPEIDAAYDRLDPQGKRFFHPGFLGSERLSIRGIAGRVILRMSSRPGLVRLLRRLPAGGYVLGAVAREGTHICGFAFVLVSVPVGRRPPTFGVFVTPTCEGRGIGSRLMEFVLDRARTEGVREVHLTVQVANDRARRLYERHGFVTAGPVSQGDWYEGEAYDSHRMILTFARTHEPHDEASSS